MIEWVQGGDAMTIGKTIRSIRKEKGITQKKLAELSGMAEITIRQYEADKYKPKIEQVERIAKALEVTAADLMGIEYFDATIDTEQIRKEVDALESIESTYGKDAVQLLTDYLSLNEQGKRKASEYLTDLSEQPKYQQPK